MSTPVPLDVLEAEIAYLQEMAKLVRAGRWIAERTQQGHLHFRQVSEGHEALVLKIDQKAAIR